MSIFTTNTEPLHTFLAGEYLTLGASKNVALVTLLEVYNAGLMTEFLEENGVTPQEFLWAYATLYRQFLKEGDMDRRVGE